MSKPKMMTQFCQFSVVQLNDKYDTLMRLRPTMQINDSRI